MATFVDNTNVSEEVQLEELVLHFQKLQVLRDGEASTQSFKDLKQSQKKEVLSGLIDKLDLVFTDQDKDIEGSFNVIFALLHKLDAASVTELGNKFIAKISADTNDKPLLRIKILNNYYNTFDTDSISRYEVFVAIVKYANASKNPEIIVPTFKKIDEWLKIWGASLEQTRVLYRLLLATLQDLRPNYKFPDNTSKEVQSYNTLVKLLQTFEGDSANLSDAIADAIHAAVFAIKTPEIHQCDELLEIAAIKQLEQNPTHEKLYELLKLFAIDKLDSFTAFNEKNPEYLKSLGISHDDCLKKIRLLSLASLAVEQNEIPYATISQTLKIDENDVESWVILSIISGLVDAKLDQLRKVVVINRSTQRVFTIEQWKLLSSKLGSWKENVRNLLGVVRSTQASARGSFESVGGLTNSTTDVRQRRHN